MDKYNQHYIKIDNLGRIVGGWSNGPDPVRNTSDAICINQRGGYQFRLWPDGDENPVLFAEHGVPIYVWDGASVRRRTDDDILADIDVKQQESSEPENPEESASVWDELDAAYREGVNSAYDQ